MTGCREDTISRALAQRALRVRPSGPGRWSLELVNSHRLSASATWEGEWIAIRAPLRAADDPDLPWTLLRDNAALTGPARFAWPRTQSLAIHADVAVPDPEMVSERVTTACDSVQAAAAVRLGKTTEGQAPRAGGRMPSGEPSAPWEEIAEEYGWHLTRREEHRLGVELDAPGLMNQAFLEQRSEGPIVSIEVLRAGELSPRSRQAIARFLLALTGRIGLVRAGVNETEGGPAVRLEAALPAEPPATGLELDLALEALSLACRLGMREVRALAHEPLAGVYLAHTTKE